MVISGLTVGLISLAVALVAIVYVCLSINRRMDRNPQPSFDEMCQAHLLDVAHLVDEIEEEDQEYNTR